MFSAVLKLIAKFFTGKIKFYLGAVLLLAALIFLVSCSYGLSSQRFGIPPQVLVIQCDDKALVV